MLESRRLLSITVNTLVDEADGSILDGDVSLRDAIAAATSGETINFDSALNGGTILLELGELVVQRALSIDASSLPLGITIDASGNDPTPDSTWLDGDDTNDGDGSRILRIDDGNEGTASPMTIRRVTLTGGDFDSEGGAIDTRESLTLTESNILGNHAALSGGGIYAVGPVTITVANSTISDNTAAFGQGGGIAVVGVDTTLVTMITMITIDRSVIANNRAGRRDFGAGKGGGLYYENEQQAPIDITIKDSTVSGNRAEVGGAGAFIAFRGPDAEPPSPQLTITGSTFSGNTIDNELLAGGAGAGLAFCVKYKGRALIENSTFSNNSSLVSGATDRKGGGISIFSIVPEADPKTVIRSTLRNVTITENSADEGGGLYTQPQTGPYAFDIDTTLHNAIIDRNWNGPSKTLATNIDGRNVNPSSSHNLVGENANGGTGGLSGVNGNIIDLGENDPQLAPLGNYGGPTATHYPLCGSPAVDAGNNVEIPTDPDTGMFVEWDQRGAFYKRVNDGTCGSAPDGSVVDIGAVERAGGDMDWDGDLDFDDIDDFVLGIADPAAYQEMYGTPSHVNGDFDCDGDQDFDDISGFVDCLSASLFGNLGERPRQIIESILENLIIRLVELYQESTSSQQTEVVELLFKDGSLARASDSIPLDDLLPPLDLLIQPPQSV